MCGVWMCWCVAFVFLEYFSGKQQLDLDNLKKKEITLLALFSLIDKPLKKNVLLCSRVFPTFIHLVWRSSDSCERFRVGDDEAGGRVVTCTDHVIIGFFISEMCSGRKWRGGKEKNPKKKLHHVYSCNPEDDSAECQEVFMGLFRHIDVSRLLFIFLPCGPLFASVVSLFVPSQGDLSLTWLTFAQLINKLTDLPYPSPISSSISA